MIWEIKNIQEFSKFVVRIYDRWGVLLKEYDNNYTGWDGTYHGAKMPSADYWYTISVDQIDTEITGHFSLIRK